MTGNYGFLFRFRTHAFIFASYGGSLGFVLVVDAIIILEIFPLLLIELVCNPNTEFGVYHSLLSMFISQDAIKTALLLGAIDREIGGIAISGKRGTAKTVMSRGLHAMLPPIEVVSGSISNADPSRPEE